MLVVAKRRFGSLNPSVFFHEDVLRTVDHDVGHTGLFEEHLERTEAECLVKDFFDEPFAFRAIQQGVFRIAKMLDDETDLAPERIALQVTQAGQVELLDQFAVDDSLELFKLAYGLFSTSLSAGKLLCGHLHQPQTGIGEPDSARVADLRE